jgi:cytochrome c553
METVLQLSQHASIVVRCAIFAAIGVSVTLVDARAQASKIPRIVSICVPCHGVSGTGGDVEKPNLAGQKSIYLRQQLEAFRSGRRKHPDMKSISRSLTDREIDQLVVYYSTLAP